MSRWNERNADGDEPFYLNAVQKENENTGELVETDKAKLYITAEGEKLWLPISQIISEDPTAEVVIIPTWLARKKGLA